MTPGPVEADIPVFMASLSCSPLPQARSKLPKKRRRVLPAQQPRRVRQAPCQAPGESKAAALARRMNTCKLAQAQAKTPGEENIKNHLHLSKHYFSIFSVFFVCLISSHIATEVTPQISSHLLRRYKVSELLFMHQMIPN